jgi:hypothetical protein
LSTGWTSSGAGGPGALAQWIKGSNVMMKTVAAISAALMLGTMSQAALAQLSTTPAAPAAPAKPAVTAPAIPGAKPAAAAATAPAKPAAAAPKTIVGAKPAPPVNACKGLVETDCGAKAEECGWVKSYKTKAGKQVAGYCKSKPKPKAAAAKPAPKVMTAPATAVKPSAPAAMPPAAKPAATVPAAPKN